MNGHSLLPPVNKTRANESGTCPLLLWARVRRIQSNRLTGPLSPSRDRSLPRVRK